MVDLHGVKEPMAASTLVTLSQASSSSFPSPQFSIVSSAPFEFCMPPDVDGNIGSFSMLLTDPSTFNDEYGGHSFDIVESYHFPQFGFSTPYQPIPPILSSPKMSSTDVS